jgi:hypothetical protein
VKRKFTVGELLLVIFLDSVIWAGLGSSTLPSCKAVARITEVQVERIRYTVLDHVVKNSLHEVLDNLLGVLDN